jgi:CheY-like chemotaxis protein
MEKKKKILVVDDEESFTKLIKLNLEQTGKYEVKTENKGLLALAAAREFKPDLILLDVIMPETDGGDVCYQLKNEKDTENIPIVFLTAAVNEEEVKESSGVIGGHPFIAKPVSVERLINVIEKNIH